MKSDLLNTLIECCIVFGSFFFLMFCNFIWFSAARRLWDTWSWSLAVHYPGKLCYPLILTAITLCCQSPHHCRHHHNGDWLSGMCGCGQRESSITPKCKCMFIWLSNKDATKHPLLCITKTNHSVCTHNTRLDSFAGIIYVISMWVQNIKCLCR